MEGLCDGLAEDVITALSKFRWVNVLRISGPSYGFGDFSQLSRELGAQYIRAGKIRRAGTRVRITAQFIDAGSGKHIWAERVMTAN
jgi:TolB-like protein